MRQEDKEKKKQVGKKKKDIKMNRLVEIAYINSHDLLVNFLIDILDLDENVESEENLLEYKSYKILYSLLEKVNNFTVVIENQYVDRVYRDSYYMHYSCKHAKYDRFCKRLFLFSGAVYDDESLKNISFPDLDPKMLQSKIIGTVVIRPLKEGKIGRTLINPYYFVDKKNTYLRYTKYTAVILGIKLRFNAFPFSMQDTETTTCAEITILNLIDYFSRKYSEYKNILPSEIAHIAVKNGYERNIPTKGLGYSVMTKVFSEAGFSPRLYDRDQLMELSQFKRIMHYYVESGLPVAIGIKDKDDSRHSIIGIGHGKIQYNKLGKKVYAVYNGITDEYIWIIDTADLCNEYIVMDDGQTPYEHYEWKIVEQEKQLPNKYLLGTYEPDVLMVPLYKRMFLEAQDAYDICTSVLASKKLGIQKFFTNIGTKDYPIVIRLFMASSRNFKLTRIANFGKTNEDVKIIYGNLRLPKFVWVCEIYDINGYPNKEAVGEIVIDATASPYDHLNSVILIHYPHYIMVLNKDDEYNTANNNHDSFEIIPNWEEFKGYDHNLLTPKK